MTAPFSILALDFHNTIYDEVMEFGLAIDAAVSVWIAAGQGKVDRQTLYNEMSAAHADLGSDWDEDVWSRLPSLQKLGLGAAAFESLRQKATEARRAKSRALTISGAFEGALETLRQLKKNGIRLYVITEAAADVGMQGMAWLELAGVIDGVYSYPSRAAPLKLEGTYHQAFPEEVAGHLKKPHPFLLAAVVLDDAKRTGQVPQNATLEDVFGLAHDTALALAEFPPASPLQKDVTARLVVKESPYQKTLQNTLDSLLYVGDSKFKDGFLARGAGVKFGLAAYGKKIKPGMEADFNTSQEILYAVTGWDKEALKLTQEAGRSKAVGDLNPDFVFENSLTEALPLFEGKNA